MPCKIQKEVILGTDAQTLFDFKITTVGVEIEHQLFQWEKESSFPIRARHTYKIPAHSVQAISINVQGSCLTRGSFVATRNKSNFKFRDGQLNLISGILSNQGSHSRRHLFVENKHDENFFIKKGEIIGVARNLENSEICNFVNETRRRKTSQSRVVNYLKSMYHSTE